MKIIFTIIILSINLSWASNGYSQNDRLSVNMKQKSVREVFAALEKSSGYRFFYNDDFNYLDNLVSVQAEKQSLNQILDGILRQTDFDYKILENKLVVVSIKEELLQAKVKVSGKVTDQNGQPMYGVTVSIKGTQKSILTDANGFFIMEVVDKKSTLVFSFIGFITQEHKLTGESTVNIELVTSIKSLDEVVVVGYGTQKKVNLTGSVASVNRDVLKKIPPVASTTNALAGRLPGLISKQNSGSPGRDAALLSIRGFGNALVIVDGVESGFNNIDPNEIESISVLKDASAAIYGARAGNGVILVTTKRGNDSKPIITLNSSYSLQNITDYPKRMSSGQYAEYDREKKIHQGIPEEQQQFTLAQVNKYYEGTDPDYPNTDWYKVLIKTFAPMQQHNLSVSGGSDKIKYFGLLGYMDQSTFWKNNGGDFNRFNIRSNIDAKITDDLSMQVNFSNINEIRQFPARDGGNGDGGMLHDYWSSLPIYASSLPDPLKLPFGGNGGLGGAVNSSNREILGFADNDVHDIKVGTSLKYEFPFAKGLIAKAFINYAQNYNSMKIMDKPGDFYLYSFLNNAYTLKGTWSPEADIRQRESKSRTITNQFSFNYDRVIAKDHAFSVLALYESINYSDDYIEAQRYHFLTPAIEYLFAGSVKDQYANGSASEMGRKSYIGRLNYSFKSKYLFEATFRADASAKFPSEKRWGYFPSLSGGWRISEESFIKDNISWLENLKLRGGLSNTGYDNVSNFAYLSGYQFGSNYIFGTSIQNGLTSSGLPNPNLTWEKMSNYNLGLDFSLIKRIFYGEFDVFYRKREGIPATRLLSLPSTFGASLPPENLNSLNDRGFEAMIGTRGSKGDFSWDLSGNVSWSRSKWEHFEEPDYSTDPEKASIYQISGQWVDRQMGYLTNGVYTSQKEIDAMTFDQDQRKNISIKPGDIKYIDVNKDSVLDWKDRVDIGTGSIPHWMYGLSANLRYKNFDFSILLQGAFGNTNAIINPENTNFQGNAETISEEMFAERWTDVNNNPKAPFIRSGSVAQGGGFSNFYIRKAGYIRLKTLNIGYNLPKELLKFAKISDLRIYFAGTNLLTFDRLKKYGLDPESPSNSFLYYPQQRTFTLGLSITL